MNSGALEQLGYGSAAEKVYLALLKSRPVSVAEIARLTGLHRPVVYKTLPHLLEAQLVTAAKSGKRLLYKAESPTALHSLVKKRERYIEKVIPEYVSIFKKSQRKTNVSFFEGRDGIHTAYEQFVNAMPKDGMLYRYESPTDHTKNKKYYPRAYWKRANRNADIYKYVITNPVSHKRRQKTLNRETKALPSRQSETEFNITMLTNDTQVLIIDFETENATLIEHPRLAAFQKLLFMTLFERL